MIELTVQERDAYGNLKGGWHYATREEILQALDEDGITTELQWCKTHECKTDAEMCVVWRLANIAGSPSEKRRPSCVIVTRRMVVEP